MMKKIIFIGLLFLSFGAVAQTKISATLVRNNPSDTYPVTFDSLQRGGMHVYSTIAERDAIPTSLRKKGMLAAVDTVIYQLKTGISNTDWGTFKPGGSTTPTLQQVTNIDSTTTRKVTVGKFRITDLPEFENNDSALAAGLQNGDQYRLPYNDGSYRVATAKVEPPITMGLTVGAGNNVYLQINSSRPSQSVDWGDGQVQLNISGFNHTYANAGTYVVKIIYNNYSTITTINFFTNTVLSSYSQPYLPSLSTLAISGQTLSTANVNAILIQLNNYGYAGVLNLTNQSPPAPPTGNGIIAKNAINARGGTVTTD